MKLKLLLLSLLIATNAANARVTTTYDDTYVSSSVVYNGIGLYTYSYNITPELFTTYDISNFEIFFCEDAKILNARSNIRFTEELGDRFFKFDSIEDDNNDKQLWFTFDSPNAPEIGDVAVKYARTETFAKEYVPSCVTIPEPSVVGLSFLGMLLLLRRKR
jgi:hypothetical protein